MNARVRSATAGAAALAVVAAGLLAGCAPTVALHPAPEHADDPHCADVEVRLPSRLDSGDGEELQRRDTDAQSTAAWGDPTSVIYSCGVAVPGATTLPCVQLGAVYWLRQKDGARKVWVFTTFGRDPAVQLTISTKLSPGVVLDQLGSRIAHLPENGRVCTSTGDTVTGESLPR